MPLSQGNIGNWEVTFYNADSNLDRFESGTENPRADGSIRPLATINQGVAFGFRGLLSNIRRAVTSEPQSTPAVGFPQCPSLGGSPAEGSHCVHF